MRQIYSSFKGKIDNTKMKMNKNVVFFLQLTQTKKRIIYVFQLI